MKFVDSGHRDTKFGKSIKENRKNIRKSKDIYEKNKEINEKVI